MSVEFLHTFSVANATLLQSAAANTGTNLQSLTGSGRVQSGRGYRSADPTMEYATNQAFSVADYITQATWRQVTAETGNKLRLMARRASANAMYFLEYDSATADVKLYVRSGGTNTQIGSSHSWSPSTATDYVFQLICQGSSISVKIDGSTVIGPVTNATNTAAGQAGFLVTSSGTNGTGKDWQIDNISVDTIVATSTAVISSGYAQRGLR